MRVVFDTNIYISGILFSGFPRKAIEYAVEGKFDLFITKDILDEIEAVFGRKKFSLSKVRLQLVMKEIEALTVLTIANEKIANVCRDIKDHIILECALASQSEVIVTGDKELLILGTFRKIKIVSAKEFVESIA